MSVNYLSPENNTGSYNSWDGRLYSQHPNRKLRGLDKAPYSTGLQRDGDVTFKDMYTRDDDDDAYFNGNAWTPQAQQSQQAGFPTKGQIRYYVDDTIARAHLAINHPHSNNSSISSYVDPMGTLRPQWTLSPPLPGSGPLINLSFIRDTDRHRQDLMSKQQEKFNQQRSDVFLRRQPNR
jgi:hypothetical protein